MINYCKFCARKIEGKSVQRKAKNGSGKKFIKHYHPECIKRVEAVNGRREFAVKTPYRG